MENLFNMVITIVSGVLVFVFGQLFMEFILRPIQEYKKLKGKVAKYLTLYAQYYYNPKYNEDIRSEKYDEASNEMRELAAEVAGFAETTPGYLITFFIIPKREKLKTASSQLIGLSNSFYTSKYSKASHAEFTTECETNIQIIMKIK